MGYGWQNKIFRESENYFDPVQRQYEINIPIEEIEEKHDDYINIYMQQEMLILEYITLNHLFVVLSEYESIDKLVKNIQYKSIDILNKLYGFMGDLKFQQKYDIVTKNNIFIKKNIQSTDVKPIKKISDELLSEMQKKSASPLVNSLNLAYIDNSQYLCNKKLNLYNATIFEQYINIFIIKKFITNEITNINDDTEIYLLTKQLNNFIMSYYNFDYSNLNIGVNAYNIVEKITDLNMNEIRIISRKYKVENDLQKKYIEKYKKYKYKYLLLKKNIHKL
jgi:hypothetical protein